MDTYNWYDLQCACWTSTGTAACKTDHGLQAEMSHTSCEMEMCTAWRDMTLRLMLFHLWFTVFCIVAEHRCFHRPASDAASWCRHHWREQHQRFHHHFPKWSPLPHHYLPAQWLQTGSWQLDCSVQCCQCVCRSVCISTGTSVCLLVGVREECHSVCKEWESPAWWFCGRKNAAVVVCSVPVIVNYLCVCMCMYVCVCASVHACVLCVCMCMCVCIHACMYVCVLDREGSRVLPVEL